MGSTQMANVHNGAGLVPGHASSVVFRQGDYLDPLGYSPAHQRRGLVSFWSF